jgi:hypothetical protein
MLTLDSLPVNRLKPKVKVKAAAKHLWGALFDY